MTGQKELYDIFELIYPVGIIIELATNTNPKDLFGIGEWEQIKDRFILAAGDSYAAGNTGGASTHVHSTGSHTLTITEIPRHEHKFQRQQWYSADTKTAESTGTIYSWKGGEGTGGSTSAGYTGYDGSYGYAGSNGAHNHGNTGSTSNMPPYYVAYLWRRVS